MKAEKRLDPFKYIFPQRPIGPLFHHSIMNLSGKAFSNTESVYEFYQFCSYRVLEIGLGKVFWQEFRQVHLKAEK